MHLRTMDRIGAGRMADSRLEARTTAKSQETAKNESRGAFFEMMLAADGGARKTETSVPRANSSSSDEISTAVRGGTQPTAPRATSQAAVRTTAAVSEENTPAQTPTTFPAGDPVETLNGLLSKLGYDPAQFGTKVTSTTISYPGMTYEYPLLEVTVNGEKVGFHLQSAANDLRMTAANIASMLGRPVMNFAEFA